MYIMKMPNTCCCSVEAYGFYASSRIFDVKKLAKEFVDATIKAPTTTEDYGGIHWKEYKIITALVTVEQGVEEALHALGFVTCFKGGEGANSYHPGTTLLLMAADPSVVWKKCKEICETI